MAAPALTVYRNGQASSVSGDNLNTFEQTCDTVTNLKSFVGISGLQVYLRGLVAPGDGGQGVFYWDGESDGPDNGLSIIVPNGAAVGAWIRLTSTEVLSYAYLVPVTGFSSTIPNYTNQLILDPATSLSSGTVNMPLKAFDGQTVGITSSQSIAALTVAGSNGQVVLGAPTTISANTPVRWIYRLENKTWYRT